MAGNAGVTRDTFSSEEGRQGLILKATCQAMVPTAAGGSLPTPPLGTYDLGVRPEHIAIAAGPRQLPFVPVDIELVESLGSQTMLYAMAPGGHSLTILAEGQLAPAPGTRIDTYVDPSRCHFCAADGKSL